MTDQEFKLLLNLKPDEIQIQVEEEYRHELSEEILGETDIKDVPFLAAIHKNCKIRSDDKDLQ